MTWRARLIVETVHCRQQTRPHQPTLSRILNAAVDSAALAAVVNGAVQGHAKGAEPVAVDGKTLRGTIEPGRSQGQPLLSIYDTDHGLVLGQVAVGHKASTLWRPSLILSWA